MLMSSFPPLSHYFSVISLKLSLLFFIFLTSDTSAAPFPLLILFAPYPLPLIPPLHLTIVRSINQSWRLDFNKCHITSSRAASVEQTYPKGKGERESRGGRQSVPLLPWLQYKATWVGRKAEQDDSAIKLSSSLAFSFFPMITSCCLQFFPIWLLNLCVYFKITLFICKTQTNRPVLVPLYSKTTLMKDL